MRITNLLKKEAIALNVNVSDKDDAISNLVYLHEKCGNLKDASAYREDILKRESMGTTAVGMEIAIPHAKSKAVKTPALSVLTVPNGVNYGAADGKPCKLIFMIAATTDGDVHLEVLSRLMQLLMDEEFTLKLKTARTADEFLSIIDAKETEKFPDEVAEPSEKKLYRVLAVTACPTGIAHTYMAAEALVKAGKNMGVAVKVETNGSGGAKNVLTSEEIESCDGIIIAADKSVSTARFNGKPVYTTKVADGINKPEELINKIINGEAPVYHAGNREKTEVSDVKNESLGRQIYKHLMNGVSHMLPFVVAGGIFIAIAFLIDAAMGVQAEGNNAFGTVTPIAAWFKTIGGYAFNFMLPILAGFIAKSIADRPGLLVGFVGGFLASNGATFADPFASSTVPSGFLGALFAGFVAGYLMLFFEKLCDRLPDSLEGIRPVLIYPLAGLGIVGVMMCAVNPIMGMVNTGLNNGLNWLNENNLGVLLGCILGAMMSIDMGGPFNKAAYTFASVGLAGATTANYQIMASVMIGGMIPPLVIALSTTFFKSRWTADERKNGVVNYIMGLSFITEGAIPYAASSPFKVIPACAIGAATAGGLSWIFGCTLMAPHGGIFVVATIGNPLMYLLSLAIGAVVGMLLLAVFKKPIDSTKGK